MFHNNADGIGLQFYLACSEYIILIAVSAVAGHAWSLSASTQTEAATAAVLQPVL